MVTTETTDYNAIVQTITDAQRHGDEYPAEDKPQITVDRYARIVMSRYEPTDPALSHVQHGTFAALMTDERYRRDLAVARQKLPPGTYYEPTRGVDGWYYSVVTKDFRNRYVFCAYFDGADYKVRLIQPDLENNPRVAGHPGHLYSNGLICLSKAPGSGQPTLELAYSKSVLWAHGVDFARKGYKFPFAYDQ
jgi:hypothetical protein